MALRLYTCIVFYINSNTNVMKFRNVNNIDKLYNHCHNIHGAVKYINIYCKESKEYLYRLDKEQANSKNNGSDQTSSTGAGRLGLR
jgi:hypothetical protein